MITPDRCLIYPSSDFVRNIIDKHIRSSSLPIVIDCSYIYTADFTAANAIVTLFDSFKSKDKHVLFFNLKPSVAHVFEGVHSNLPIYSNIDALETALNDINKTTGKFR